MRPFQRSEPWMILGDRGSKEASNYNRFVISGQNFDDSRPYAERARACPSLPHSYSVEGAPRLG